MFLFVPTSAAAVILLLSIALHPNTAMTVSTATTTSAVNNNGKDIETVVVRSEEEFSRSNPKEAPTASEEEEVCLLARQRHRDLGERLVVPEWDHHDDNDNNDDTGAAGGGYRRIHGWRGHDLVHSPRAPVRITDYVCKYGPGTDIRLAVVANNNNNNDHHPPHAAAAAVPQQQQRGGAGTVLTGTVHFTERAESHAGFCHGGSMCSVMDDVVGWIAFCATGRVRPWTGFTVQVNTALKRPVRIHSTLTVRAVISRIERRKVYVTATLYDDDPHNQRHNHHHQPAAAADDDNDDDDKKDAVVVHATCEGVVVLNKGILVIEEKEVAAVVP